MNTRRAQNARQDHVVVLALSDKKDARPAPASGLKNANEDHAVVFSLSDKKDARPTSAGGKQKGQEDHVVAFSLPGKKDSRPREEKAKGKKRNEGQKKSAMHASEKLNWLQKRKDGNLKEKQEAREAAAPREGKVGRKRKAENGKRNNK